MAETPTPENFYELSLAADRYVDVASKAIVFELDEFACNACREDDIPRVAAACDKLLAEKYGEIITDDCKRTLAWFEAEPAFAMAAKSLDYIKVEEDHWKARVEREIARWAPASRHGKICGASMLALRIARIPSHYIRYVSLVSEAAYKYVSGNGHRAAIEGPSTIRRLKDLIGEFEEVMSAEWLPDDLRKSLTFAIDPRQAIKHLNYYEEMPPLSRRNDTDLPTRLFATELLRINQQIFKSFHKKAVFHLMGLSFVQRPLEMRTIERLAKSETDAHREYMAKKISDKRGLDFDYVLTTLKANKSLTLPR